MRHRVAPPLPQAVDDPNVGRFSHYWSVQWHSRRSNPEDLAALHEGVPPWMRQPLLNWVYTVMHLRKDSTGFVDLGPTIDSALLEEFEMLTRRPESLLGKLDNAGLPAIYDAMEPEEFLDFVDFLVFHTQNLGGQAVPYLDGLDHVLQASGSEWTVGERDGHAALEKRVPEGVVATVDQTVANAGEAGSLLAEAWRAVFGRSPDPEDAYEKAIKAVEEAGARVVSPMNMKATLGTMIRDMKTQKTWSLDLPTDGAGVPVEMADALWDAQESRHGGNGYRKPTQAEAEAAVMLAVPLVQWFTSGAIKRRS